MIERGRLDDLAAFACVARHRSYTRAAAELGLSTSNLSHIIKRLEQRLGVRLLQRNSRSVAASEAGESLLAALGPALDGVAEALDALQQGRDAVKGLLRITATRQAYDAVLRPVLPAFTERHPEAVIEVEIDYAFRDIITDRFDAGIRLGEKLQQDMIAVSVGPELRMAVVASPAYLAAHGAPSTPEDLVRHRCVNYRMTAAGVIYAWEFERDGKALEVRVPGPLIFNEPALMLECALEGLGVAYVLEHEAAPHLAQGALVRVLEDWTPPFPGFFLYHPSRRQTRPVLTALMQMLRSSRS